MADFLTDEITRIVETMGYLGVGALVAIENVFPPIPSELVLPLAGFVARRGDGSVLGMILASTIGSVIGAWILYLLAASIGQDRLRRLVERHGRWVRLKPRDLDRANDWFARRGSWAVCVGRCVPLIRSIVSIPAGFARMPAMRFTVLTAIGSVVWNSALIGAGAVLGDQWHRVGDAVALAQVLVIVAAGSVLARLVWVRSVRPRLLRRVEG